MDRFFKEPYTVHNIKNFVISFFNFWGTPNWYQGVDKPNLWESIYKWRISAKTAWTLSNGIWFNKFKK